MLRLTCPACGAQHADDFESIEAGAVGKMHCEGGEGDHVFWFILCECLACGEETTFTWTQVPGPTDLSDLSCSECGVPFHEADREAEDEGTPRHLL